MAADIALASHVRWVPLGRRLAVVRYTGQIRIIAPDPSEEVGWMPGLRVEQAGPQLLMAH